MFWETFFALCKKNGTTPTAVAKELGFSNSTATQWKKGGMPRSAALKAIADYFGISVEALLAGGGVARTEPAEAAPGAAAADDPAKRALLDLWEELTPGERALAMERLKKIKESR